MSAKKDQTELPKYMTLDATTQFELAQSIDEVLARAEKATQLSDEQACLNLWLQQIVDHFQDEFAIELDEATFSPDFDAFKNRVAEVISTCRQEQSKHGMQDVKVRIRACLEHSYQGALDLMQIQNLWRFDLQRQMQERQEALLHEVDSSL
ncbi:hypothetical protein HF888_13315 [Bermanella marisrubri]|uniref:Uncharacterized protein n=1 Tax=Bermanella marisrubri TaxID=207949 RepID=Q1N349_9GAMM|nr:hypothetical protein [Bermanella marisrubri]EAT12742.1 hypothetical protein RED65_13697 [Oceanobacter sp. RED65] [Bermanella marisrubri]QIZ85141.1 hypothetical protein HF888_13315 [Bermanella marisrubri]